MLAERPSLVSPNDDFPEQSTSKDSSLRRPKGISMGNTMEISKEARCFKERRNKMLNTLVVEGEDQSMNSCLKIRRRREKKIREKGGKEVGRSIPETVVVDQLDSHISGRSEEIFCKSKRNAEDLADNMDKIELTRKVTEDNLQNSGNANLGDNVMRDITNGQLSPKKQDT